MSRALDAASAGPEAAAVETESCGVPKVASFVAGLGLVLAFAPARAEPPEKQTLSLENAATRVVDCAVVVDGKTRTMLKMQPGKSWSDAYDPRRDVRLVCERAKKMYWRVEAGTAYRLEDAGNRRVDLAAAGR